MDKQSKRILIVEDEFLIADDLACNLHSRGWEIVGPVGSVADALNLIALEGGSIDGATLDVKLGHEWVDPVADVLRRRNIKFLFVSAYSTRIPRQYAGTPHCQKPCDAQQISDMLVSLVGSPHHLVPR